MGDVDSARTLVQVALGRSVSRVEEAAWGFQNRTEIITLTNGDRVVLQRYRRRDVAERRIAILRALGEPAAAAGIVIPAVCACDFDHDPPWAIFPALPGTPATGAGEFAPGGRSFVETARLMGELLATFRTLRTPDLAVDDLWSHPERLAREATGWAQRSVGLDGAERDALRAVIDDVPALFGGREAVLAHGDYAPMNVLVADGGITGLLDLESIRLADPLFDVAWWAWAVSFSSRHVLDEAFPVFLSAAAIDASDPLLARRLQVIQILRMLELLVEQPELDVADVIAGRLRAAFR